VLAWLYVACWFSGNSAAGRDLFELPSEVAAMSGTDRQQAVLLSDVGRGLARLHLEFYGRGPTKIHSHMLDDMMVCFLEGGFTTVERTLIDDGNANAVHEIRRSLQTRLETPFRDVVEKATARKVIAYMSQIHTDPDLAVELFVLEPLDEPVGTEHEPVGTEHEGAIREQA
jgi:uncharacterized protein YbcI